MKYTVYATTEKGEGITMVIFEGNLEDFDIHISMFDKDVVITFEVVYNE